MQRHKEPACSGEQDSSVADRVWRLPWEADLPSVCAVFTACSLCQKGLVAGPCAGAGRPACCGPCQQSSALWVGEKQCRAEHGWISIERPLFRFCQLRNLGFKPESLTGHGLK